jgi:16S rRNA C967 or C1407 C5-methylase (RsmB/RsmF family)/NOL1/NOP2/fmu family ribosome biogenesis protein
MSRQRSTPDGTPVVALPASLRQRLSERHQVDVEALEQALNRPSPISLRVNPAKGFDPGGEAVPWCSTGRYLTERPAFTFDPLLHAGCYYVQEASSMLLEQAVRQSGLMGQRVAALDLCAAPGGKSTHLRSLLHPSAVLVANEPEGTRRAILQENLWKWGQPNVVIGGGLRPRATREPLFDLILVDAPCSGEGMFRKDPHAVKQWSEGLVRQCSAVQCELTSAAWELLRPGGTLIYSTCTWEEAENESQITALIDQGAERVPLTLPAEVPVVPGFEGAPGVRSYPHLVQGEGFFLAMLRKPGTWTALTPDVPSPSPRAPWADWLCPTEEDVHATELDGVVHVVDAGWRSLMRKVDAVLRVVSPGIPVAERKSDVFHPLPALALNALLRDGAFPKVAVDEAQALRYLRGEALEASDAQGFALLTYQGQGLGWLKGAGRRWNNRWPAPWRIRATQPLAERVSWSAGKDT